MSKLFLGGLISAFCAIAGLVASPAAAAEITLNLATNRARKTRTISAASTSRKGWRN